MLEIRNLQGRVEGKPILRGVDLAVAAGEVHAIMGPNGSGKSTLAQLLAGRETFTVTGGEARYLGRDLLAMAPEERAREGVFLAFQYPVELPGEMIYRAVNEGFSGGEKKRNEILQMAVLEPRLAILDETDSGLDIDALQVVASGINALRSPGRAIILVTHYQRILNYVAPDHVHVLLQGRIVKSGGKELAFELEERGYGWLEPTAGPVSQAA